MRRASCSMVMALVVLGCDPPAATPTASSGAATAVPSSAASAPNPFAEVAGIKPQTFLVKTAKRLAFSADAGSLAGTHDDGLSVWDTRSGERVMLVPIPGHAYDITWCSRNHSVAVRVTTVVDGMNTSSLRIHRVPSGELATEVKTGQVAACDPSTGSLAVGTDEGVRIYDETITLVRTLKGPKDIRSLSWTSRGSTVAVAYFHGKGSAVELWDALAGKRRSSHEAIDVAVGLAFSHDDAKLAWIEQSTGGIAEHRVVVLDVDSQRQHRATKLVQNMRWLRFSPDDRWVASAPAVVNLWSASDASWRGAPPRGDEHIAEVAFTADGKGVVSLGEKTLWVHDATTLEKVAEESVLNTPLPPAYAVSPSNRWLAAGGVARVKLLAMP